MGILGKGRLLRTEQKSMILMAHFVSKFCRAGKLLVDTSAGTLLSANACLQLSVHRINVECERTLPAFRTWSCL